MLATSLLVVLRLKIPSAELQLSHPPACYGAVLASSRASSLLNASSKNKRCIVLRVTQRWLQA